MPDYMTVCEQAARAAGATLLDWVGKFSVREKGLADLVTEADVASQETIRRIVLSAFPGHSLLGEEDSPANGPQERSEYRWVADPLDGTTNYVHGVPHFAVSLALERNGVPLVGAIFDPLLEECFCATAGRGAYVNGSRIQVSQVDELSEAVACAGLPPGVKRDSPDLRIFTEAALRFQAVRRTGSAALNFAYLAAGRFDALWSFSNKIWDVIAGYLLVQEAGGIVTAPDGGPFVLEKAQYVAAATPSLHRQLLELVGQTLGSLPSPSEKR